MTEVTERTADAPLLRFRPYPEYRDSGVKWLGKIPAHWEVKPVKAALVRNESGVWGEDFDDDGTIVLRSTEQTMQGTWRIEVPARRRLSAREATYARLREGDLLVTKSSGSAHHIGKTSIVDEAIAALNCCYSNFMQRLSVSAEHVPQFFWYFMNCPVVREQLVFLSSTTTGLGNLNGSILGAIRISMAPPDEQRAIAAFLDRETAKIDALVARKERLIELLQEKRTALITRAVTRGLDPNVPMKDSGVEWLGEVPAHWDVKQWRYCCHVTEGQVAPDDEQFRERVLIAPNHIESGTGRILQTESAYEQGAISGKYLVKPGDIIYSKIRPALNKVCVSAGDWLCSADMYPISITESRLQTRFLLYFMLSKPFVQLMVDESMRVAMPKVNREKLADCPLLVPDPDEQLALADFIDRETVRIDSLIAKVREAIDHLKEFRTALISAAVTGKIDVRAAFAEATTGQGATP